MPAELAVEVTTRDTAGTTELTRFWVGGTDEALATAFAELSKMAGNGSLPALVAGGELVVRVLEAE